MSSKLPLTGVILAGGKSSRMKTNKCLLSLNNKKLIEILLINLKEIFEELFIVTNFPEAYFYTGFPLLGDIYPFKGPLAGIHVALKNSKYDVFAFACDMPFVKKEIVYFLGEKHRSQKNNITVSCYKEKIYPLPGIYSKEILNELENLLKEDKLSMIRLIEDIHAQTVDVANLDKEGLSFINVNTEEDLKFLEKGGKRCLG
ncbi:molybdenum cofactor guanylyltransferase [Thermodesulfovibrio sp. 3907-1M]|uniref:Probable molybdenum cofactor guanylyltransferase n=1 Tax=Thermodesulfovibrio autotrophicus TaxID=3118333 RepID=A0AAU8GV15_9BACT